MTLGLDTITVEELRLIFHHGRPDDTIEAAVSRIRDGQADAAAFIARNENYALYTRQRDGARRAALKAAEQAATRAYAHLPGPQQHPQIASDVRRVMNQFDSASPPMSLEEWEAARSPQGHTISRAKRASARLKAAVS